MGSHRDRARAGCRNQVTRARKYWRLAAVALFIMASAFSLAALAPAGLVGSLIEYASANRLTLAGASGRVWEGRGTLTARSTGARVLLGWTLQPKELVFARLSGTVSVGAAQPTRFIAARSSLEVDRIDVALPAAIVAEALGAYSGYTIGGTVQIRSQRVYLHHENASARIALEWAHAATGVIAVAPLGHYRADLEWIAGTASINVRTHEGPLHLDGNGRWSGNSAALALNARASGEQAETLKAWLRTMTPEQPGGIFRFVWPQPSTKTSQTRPGK